MGLLVFHETSQPRLCLRDGLIRAGGGEPHYGRVAKPPECCLGIRRLKGPKDESVGFNPRFHTALPFGSTSPLSMHTLVRDNYHCGVCLRRVSLFEVTLRKKSKFIFVATVIVAVLAGLAIHANMQVHATAAENARKLSGDELIPNPIGVVNHAITIHRPPPDVWPWLAQMGSGRAGWYSYDFIDNGGHRSTERILPEFQDIAVGSVFPALPGARDVFVVAQYEPERSLVLCWRLPDGHYQTTWAFVLEQRQPGQTRLVVRGRVASGYRPYGLPQWAALLLGRAAHFIMQRKQLLSIRERAETGIP